MHAFIECFDDDPNTIYHLKLALTLLNSVMKVALCKMSDISFEFSVRGEMLSTFDLENMFLPNLVSCDLAIYLLIS
jgi:hypothetical protein